MTREDIKAALNEFYTFLNEAGLPYYSQDDLNSNLITAFGAIKTTHGVPGTMWQGVTAFSRKAPCLIVDFKGLKGFSASLLAERLKTQWPGLKTLDSYQISFAQIAQNICWHLCKALKNKLLQRLELNSTFCIFMIPACPGWVSVNLIVAVLTVAAE